MCATNTICSINWLQNWINQNNFSIIFQKNTALSNSPDCNRMTCSLLLAQGMNKRISPIKPILIHIKNLPIYFQSNYKKHPHKLPQQLRVLIHLLYVFQFFLLYWKQYSTNYIYCHPIFYILVSIVIFYILFAQYFHD